MDLSKLPINNGYLFGVGSCIVHGEGRLDPRYSPKWPSPHKLIVSCRHVLEAELRIALLVLADYGASEEVSEGSVVRTSEAAGSPGLSGGTSKGRCSWLN